MNAATHWEKTYREKAPDAVSWYRPHLETSLELIGTAAPQEVFELAEPSKEFALYSQTDWKHVK